MVDNDANRLA